MVSLCIVNVIIDFLFSFCSQVWHQWASSSLSRWNVNIRDVTSGVLFPVRLAYHSCEFYYYLKFLHFFTIPFSSFVACAVMHFSLATTCSCRHSNMASVDENGAVVELTEDDIPGAKLSEPLDAHTTHALRWWLHCRGLMLSPSFSLNASSHFCLLPKSWGNLCIEIFGFFPRVWPHTTQTSPGILNLTVEVNHG